MKKNRFITFIIFFVITKVSFTQNIDSLKQCLNAVTNDTIRLQLLTQIGKASHIQRVTYWDTLLEKAKQINYKKAQADALFQIGLLYDSKGEYPKAIENLLNALTLYEKLFCKKEMAQTLSNIGGVYFSNANYSQAQNYSEQSLSVYKKIKSCKGICQSLSQIGLALYKQAKYEQALSYLHKALLIAKQNKLTQMFAIIYSGISNVYLAKKEYTQCITYLNLSLQYANKYFGEEETAIPIYNIGNCYLRQAKYDSAEVYLLKALNICEKYNNKKGQAMSHEYLSKNYEGKGDFKNSLKHYQLYVALKDSLFNNETDKKIAKAELNYQFEKKALASKLEQEKKLNEINLQAERKNTQNKFIVLGLLSLLVLAGIGAFVFYRNRKQEKRIQQIEQQAINQKLLRLQMNPHFIFNALSTLQNFIYNDKKVEAGKYLTKVSKLIRDILETSRQEFITLDKEIETLDNYLKINQTLLANQFNYNITIDEAIETDVIEVPPMMIQPFIENALKHGVQNLSNKGLINVSITLKNNNVLSVEIQDNGLGFVQKEASSTSASNSKHQSLATTITKERLAHILNTSTQKININVHELKDEQQNNIGVKTSFEIPYRNKEL